MDMQQICTASLLAAPSSAAVCLQGICGCDSISSPQPPDAPLQQQPSLVTQGMPVEDASLEQAAQQLVQGAVAGGTHQHVPARSARLDQAGPALRRQAKQVGGAALVPRLHCVPAVHSLAEVGKRGLGPCVGSSVN